MSVAQTALTLALIHFLSVSSPGPDMLLVIRNTLSYSRRRGIATALGITIGNAFHLAYSVFLATVLGERNGFLLNILRLAGALYLGWIGMRCLIATSEIASLTNPRSANGTDSPSSTPNDGFLMGLSCCALNAKASIYYVSIATQFIRPTAPTWINLAFASEFLIIAAIWFTTVAIFFGNTFVRTRFIRRIVLLDKVMGVALIGFALATTLTLYGSILP